jgi:glycosyltransferase involved in cell wall biosynthesis
MGAESKASSVVLDAFAEVAPSFPEWSLVLVGSMTDAFAERYETMLEANPGLEKRVEHLGFISDRQRLYKQYQRAKVFAQPSRYEGFGVSLVESGYFGDVLLGTDIPPFREYTDDGRLGYLCPVDDVECFADRLEYMFDHEDELQDRSDLVHGRVVEHYDWHGYCTRMDELVRQTSRPE